MRIPRPRDVQTRTKTIIMTGGLNDIVTNLELKEGELHRVKNYMEMDSPYHGYVSIGGYEVYDGKNAPSSIAAPPIEDSGINDTTTLLLEAISGPTDLSDVGIPVSSSGVGAQSNVTKFGDLCWQFNNSYLSVGDVTTTADIGTDWTIEFQVRLGARTSTVTIFEKEGCYRFTVDAAGNGTFETSDNGSTYTDSVSTGDQGPVSILRFTHISISSKNGTFRMAINGEPTTVSTVPETATPTAIWTNTNPLIIGADAGLSAYTEMYLDEFRMSSTYLWNGPFVSPTIRYTREDFWTINWDDVEREAQRLNITEVPGQGPVRGVHIYGGEVYALRNADPSPGAGLYRANRNPDGSGGYLNTSGWVLVDTFPNADGRLVAFNSRFSGNFNDQEVMVMCDGANIPRIWDGTTMTVLDPSYKETAGGVGDGVAKNLPDNQVSPRYATVCSVYDGRTVFGYEADEVYMSSNADPGDFDGGFGSQFNIGDTINGFRVLPKDSMAIFCRNSIKMVTKLDTPSNSTSLDYFFRLDDYSEGTAGGYPYTMERVLNRVLFADDRGIMDLSDTDTYADFNQSAISKKVNRVYLSKKHLSPVSTVDKESNQYRIYFSDGTGLYFTFQEDKLKGATFVDMPITVAIVASGEDPDGNIVKFFSSGEDDGFVYQLDSGTSFNGEAIDTLLNTAFYHYGSPSNWKRFLKAVFEITASRGTVFNVRTVFDYDDAEFPSTLWFSTRDYGDGGRWDEDNWGTFSWGEGIVSRLVHYILGTGTNMSIEIRTSSKYDEQHIIQNAIVNYELGGLKQ